MEEGSQSQNQATGIYENKRKMLREKLASGEAHIVVQKEGRGTNNDRLEKKQHQQRSSSWLEWLPFCGCTTNAYGQKEQPQPTPPQIVEYSNKQKEREQRDIVDADQSLWNSSNVNFYQRGSNLSRTDNLNDQNDEEMSNTSEVQSSSHTLPVKQGTNAILGTQSSEMSDIDEKRPTTTSKVGNTHRLNDRLEQVQKRKRSHNYKSI